MLSLPAQDQSVTYVRASDSTVLAYVMKTLNDRYNYGLDLYLLSIDEGITGYRDDSLEVCAAMLCVVPDDTDITPNRQ